MAKILNYQNYHKTVTVVAQHRRRHQRHHRPQTEQQKHQQQHLVQLVQRQQEPPSSPPKTTPTTANHNRNKRKTSNSSIITATNESSNICYASPPAQHVNKSLQNNKMPTQHVALQFQQHHTINCSDNNNKSQLSQLTSTYEDANKQHCNNHSHLRNRNININNSQRHHSPKTYTLPMTTSCSSSSSSLLPMPPSSTSSPSSVSATSLIYSTYSTTCCVLTYNLFAAYAEAATLQLKRKKSFNKLLMATSGRRHSDMHSICYLILMAFVYWGVMIHAAVATNLTTIATTTTTTNHNNDGSNNLHPTNIAPTMPLAKFTSNLTMMNIGLIVTSDNHGYANSVKSQQNANNTRSDDNDKSLRPHLPISSVSSNILTNYQRRLLTRREAAKVPDFEDDDSSYHDDEFDEYEALIRNKSAKGKYIGAPCNNMSCEPTLLHVTCDKETLTCGCEKNYPVQLGLTRGCDKPKKLGEQCFYDETCQYSDENSFCVQVRHNALCQCANGFHSVSYTKPTRRVFCTQDLDELNSDLPTLLGVCVGIGVLAGLICMVLHLFSKTKYPRHRNFGDANLPPPIMYSSDTGIPLTVQSGRPSSRSSIRSSGGSIGSYGNRRSSTGGVTATTAGSKGILVSTSRTGSRRPSLASVHSTSSSVRSYSMMRFEKEQQQKEIRHEMKLRLARLQQHQQHQQLGQYKPQIIIGDTAVTMQQHGVVFGRISMATPSPMTPNSTDELLPAVDENQEYPPKLESLQKSCPESVASATLSAIKNAAMNSKLTNTANTMATATAAATAATTAAAATSQATDMANAAAYIGPCSTSTEAL